MNMQDKIKYIQTNFPMMVLLIKLKILPPNFNRKYRFPCPIHQGENPTCCRITEDNAIHCFKCTKRYDIVDVYQRTRGLDFNESIRRILSFMKSQEFKTLLQEEQQITKLTKSPFKQQYHSKSAYPTDETQLKTAKRKLLKEVSPLFNQIRDYYHYLLTANQNNESHQGIKYLTEKRKLTPATIKEFSLGFAPLSDKPLSFRFFNYCQKKNINIHKLIEYGFIKEKTSKKGSKYYHDAFNGSVIIPI